jgi:flagellar hook protein FlgE
LSESETRRRALTAWLDNSLGDNMFGSFVSALSGLKAAGTAIDSIGNDLANLNTTGFKSSSLSFQDVVADVTGAASKQIGSGVASPLIFKNFTQGAIQTTGGANNAAIQGDGFFIVRKADASAPVAVSPDVNSDLFTRAGNFQIDKNGFLVSATGERVQGWSLNTATGQVSPSDPIGDIIVPVGSNRAAKATTTFNANLNLDASAAAGAPFSVPVNIYDSLGNSHVISANFTKDTTTNSWDATITSADPAVTLTGNGPFTFTFNTDGSLQTVTGSDPTTGNITGIQLAITSGAQSPQTISWSPWQTPPVGTVPGVGRITQFAEASASSAIAQDGLPAAQLTSVSITDGGVVLADYSNGSQQQVAQLALASIRNPDSLVSIGGNNFRAGQNSAVPVVGQASTGGRGAIVGGSLESSNVDMATEFTQLIIFQRAYSADARVITTTDQVSQETINLIHP